MHIQEAVEKMKMIAALPAQPRALRSKAKKTTNQERCKAKKTPNQDNLQGAIQVRLRVLARAHASSSSYAQASISSNAQASGSNNRSKAQPSSKLGKGNLKLNHI
ncbi:hypothetical protein TSAR_003998 [Trichomalopsis sarcophagae]|uniref:Uncharacterized protein n=1 Tax=Trichomalopsis sarcophagae TaxID=543379 RepID=A0A232EE99_9HYME|nr:hypothetical protein TSAR_003998 [Trichomalopsis sarcophagae]